MTKEGVRIRCPESVLGWIPWYGETGDDGESVLTPRQRGAVQAHAAQCPDCRAEIDMISGAPFEIDVELPDPDRVFGEITERIAAVERAEGAPSSEVIPIERARRLGEDEYQRIADWLGDEEDPEGVEDVEAGESLVDDAEHATVVRGPWLAQPAWAAAAAVLLLMLGGVGGTLWSEANDVYRPASAVTAVDGPRVEVVFRGDASLQEVSDALRAAGAEIAEGPSAAGVYRLRPVASSNPDEATDAPEAGEATAIALAERLKASEARVVLFAEAVRAP